MVKKYTNLLLIILFLSISLNIYILYKNHQTLTFFGIQKYTEVERLHIDLEHNLNGLNSIKSGEIDYNPELITKMSSEYLTLSGIMISLRIDINRHFREISKKLDLYKENPTRRNLEETILVMNNLSNELNLLLEDWNNQPKYKLAQPFH